MEEERERGEESAENKKEREKRLVWGIITEKAEKGGKKKEEDND